jgi:hypothetical protein
MATFPLQFDVRPSTGSCFSINGTGDDSTAPGLMVFNVLNSANKWVDVVVETIYPSTERLFTSGRINNGQTFQAERNLSAHSGAAVHVTRWAPGFLGIPGNGGGEVFFVLPVTGNVTVNITVTS